MDLSLRSTRDYRATLSALVVLLALCLAGPALGEVLTVTFDFGPPQITSQPDGTARVAMADAQSWGAPGEPVLPRRTARILLPPAQGVTSVTVVASQWVPVPGKYSVEPGQRPYPLSKEQPVEKTQADPAIYGLTTWFPEQSWASAGEQTWRGHRMLVVNLLPVRYTPSTGRLEWCRSMDVRVDLTPAAQPASAQIALSMLPADTAYLRAQVDNPAVLDDYGIVQPLSGGHTTGRLLPEESYDYVIITNEALATASEMYDYSFQDLLDHRATAGLTATLVTTEWIYANYDGMRPDAGEDNQTRIRNFIIDAYNTWGTHYVLLGGDGDGVNVGGETGDAIIPHRGFAIDAGWEIDLDIPADMYYGCLDGTFDYDADGLYGEVGDGVSGGEVDLLAEVHIGRAAVDTEVEVSDFVAKTLAYELSSPPRDVLMVGEYLGFGGVADWGGNHKDEIKDGCDLFGYTTVGFLDSVFSESYDVSTLYDRDDPIQDWSASALIAAINSGLHVLNHLGHANNTYVMKLVNSSVDALTNTSYFVGYSQGCYAGAFDNRDTAEGYYLTQDSISEHLTCGVGGAAAFIANSRYGWGRYDSTDGPSQHFDREFWDAVLGEMTPEIGAANDDSKWDQQGYVAADIIGRWCCYELNLFGDPALRIKLGVSSQGSVNLDQPSYALPSTLQATVLDKDLDVDPLMPDTVVIDATSTTETAAEPVTCTETGNSSGIFIGTLPVVSGSATPDSQLQAADGDTITVTYLDADDGSGGVDISRTDTALVDDQAPTFAGVETASPGNQAAHLGWSSASDPSTPICYNIYRADTSGGQDFGSPIGSSTGLAYTDTGLVNGNTYYYVVRAEDAAGNEDTNEVEISVTPELTHWIQVCGCGVGQALVNGVPHSLPWAGEFPVDSVVTVLADPDTGWEFTQWCCDVNTTENPLSLVMNREWWVVANFNTATCTLTVDKTGGGGAMIDCSTETLPGSWVFPEDSVVPLKALPGDYWGFDSWSGDLTGSENPVCITMDGDKNVTANFLPHTLDVAVSADPDTVCGGKTTSLVATITDSLAHSYSMYWRDMLAFDPYITAAFGGGAPEDIALADGHVFVAAGGLMSIYSMYSSDPLAPLGICDLPGYAQTIAVSGDYAYVGTYDFGIQVVNISNKANPIRTGSSLTLRSVYEVAVSGSYLYAIGNSFDGIALHVLDIAAPGTPSLVGECAVPELRGTPTGDLLLWGGFAYASDSSDMSIVDISSPFAPTEVSVLNGVRAHALAIEGMYLYAGGEALSVFDMYAPASPVLVGVSDVPDSITGLKVSDDLVYVADRSKGLRVFDVSAKNAPAQVGLCTAPRSGWSVAVAGDRAYLAGDEGVSIIDVSNPLAPEALGLDETWGHYQVVETSGRYAFAMNWTGGVRVIDLEDPSGPTEVGSCAITGVGDVWTCDLQLYGGYVLVTGRDSGRDPNRTVFVCDISDPSHPVHIASWTPDSDSGETPFCPPQQLAVFGEYAMLVVDPCCVPSLNVFYIADPTNPVKVGGAGGSFGCLPNRHAPFEDGYAYLTGGQAGYSAQVSIADLSDPANPQIVSSFSPGECVCPCTVSLSVSNGILYVAYGEQLLDSRSLRVFDVSDPFAPIQIGTYDASEAIADTAPVGELLYVAGTRAGENRLGALNISVPGSPRLVGSHEGRGGTLGWWGMDSPRVAASVDHVCFADHGWGVTTFDTPAIPDGPLGTFSPSDSVLDPIYTAPDNPSDQDLVVLLEAVATCDGEPSLVEIGSTSLTVTPAAVMSAVGSSGPPGSVVRVPVVVDLHSLWADRFAFSVQVTPTGTAAALVEPLGFEEAGGLPVPDMVSPSGDTIAVGWLAPISEPVTESVHLGDVLVTVPGAAELGDGYDVCVLSVGLGLGSEELCVRAGDCATLSVCVDILVGDIYRMSTPTPMADENADGDICDWGEYNDDDLTLGDVFAVFDAWAQINPLGCGAGSHRFYAADSYPLDSEGVVGGNGELSFGDVFTTFDRWADPQLPRPWRKVCSEELPVTSVLSERVSVAGLGRAAPVAELVIADGAGQAGGTVRLPVTLEVGEGEVDRVAFAVEVAADQEETLSVVGFEPSGALGTPLTSSAPDGLGVAWLAPIAPALSGQVKLGDVVVAVEERAAAGATCRIHFVTVGGSLGQGEIAVAAGPDATVTVEPGEAHDVKIRRFQVPSKAKVGESKRLGVELENLTEHSEQIEVRLLREGEAVQAWSIELAGGERKKLTAEYTFAAEDSPSVTLTAEASLEGDANPEDNRASAEVSVR